VYGAIFKELKGVINVTPVCRREKGKPTYSDVARGIPGMRNDKN